MMAVSSRPPCTQAPVGFVAPVVGSTSRRSDPSQAHSAPRPQGAPCAVRSECRDTQAPHHRQHSESCRFRLSRVNSVVRHPRGQQALCTSAQSRGRWQHPVPVYRGHKRTELPSTGGNSCRVTSLRVTGSKAQYESIEPIDHQCATESNDFADRSLPGRQCRM